MCYFCSDLRFMKFITLIFNNNCLVPSAPGVIAIAEINEALNSSDYRQTLAALLLPTAKLTGVNPATAKHYYDVLQYTKQLLCQVTRISFIHSSFIKVKVLKAVHANKKLLPAVKVLILVFTEHTCVVKYILNNF